jgi:hypothetical protein
MRRVNQIESLIADVRYALRTFRKHRAFACMAILVLALGTVIDGVTNFTTTVQAQNGPSNVAVNPVTNHIYVTNYSSGNVTAIAAEQLQPKPLTTAITALAGNQTTSATPSFTFTANSAFSPDPTNAGQRFVPGA